MTSPVPFFRRKHAALLLLLGSFAQGCSGGGGDPMAQNEPSLLEVVPAMASLPPGGAETFVALAQGVVATGVEWYATAGSISSAGLFTAPAEAGSYQIQARIAGATGSATAIVSVPGTPASFHGAAAASCASMPLRTTGTVYYFCDCQAGAQAGCVAGNDASNGLTPATAKRRWYAATQAFNAMNAGDTIALCRGGAWNLDTVAGACGSADPGPTHDTASALLNARCGSGAQYTDAQLKDPATSTTCDIRDYAAWAGGTNKPLLAIPGGVTATSVLARSSGATRGVRVMNLEFRGAGDGPRGAATLNQRGIFFGSCGPATDDYWLVCNNTFSNLSRGMWMNENHSFATHMNVWGNRFLMSDQDAILGGPGSYSRIDANYFDNNGGENRLHTIYLGSYPEFETIGASIVNNEIRRTLAAQASPGACVSPVVQGHDRFTGLNVENNLIDVGAAPLGGCWGIAFSAAGSNATHYQNTTIRRNWVSASGAAIVLGQASSSVVENNVLVDTTSTSSKATILIPDNADRAQDGATTNNTIRNNTIYSTGSSTNHFGIHVLLTAGSGNVIANNAVSMGSAGTCFGTDAGTYAFVGNNACYGGAAWGTTYDATTHITANPLFTAAPTNFRPATSSPLIGAGTAAYAPAMDFTANVRPSPASIGALEP